MFVLFKKSIVVDTSGEEIRRVSDLFDEQGVKYVLRPKRTGGTIGTGLNICLMRDPILHCTRGHQNRPWSIWWMSKGGITTKPTICFIDHILLK